MVFRGLLVYNLARNFSNLLVDGRDFRNVSPLFFYNTRPTVFSIFSRMFRLAIATRSAQGLCGNDLYPLVLKFAPIRRTILRQRRVSVGSYSRNERLSPIRGQGLLSTILRQLRSKFVRRARRLRMGLQITLRRLRGYYLRLDRVLVVHFKAAWVSSVSPIFDLIYLLRDLIERSLRLRARAITISRRQFFQGFFPSLSYRYLHKYGVSITRSRASTSAIYDYTRIAMLTSLRRVRPKGFFMVGCRIVRVVMGESSNYFHPINGRFYFRRLTTTMRRSHYVFLSLFLLYLVCLSGLQYVTFGSRLLPRVLRAVSKNGKGLLSCRGGPTFFRERLAFTRDFPREGRLFRGVLQLLVFRSGTLNVTFRAFCEYACQGCHCQGSRKGSLQNYMKRNLQPCKQSRRRVGVLLRNGS